MCLGRPAAECVCDDMPVPVATCEGCGAMTDDAGILATEWEIDEGGHTWCDRCLAAFAEQHEAGCHCDACLDALARYWEGEAERAISMEAVPDGSTMVEER